jgi:hypothetical protein
MFFEDIRSERKLIETASLNLAHRWYLGYALDEPLPDHSSLTRIRQWLGIDVFQRFFEQVVELCQDAGLVWGKEFFVDATKVEANADLDSLVPRFLYEAKRHVKALFTPEAAPTDAYTGDGVDPPPTDGVLHLPGCWSHSEKLTEPELSPRWQLLEERRLDPKRPAIGTYRRTTDFRISATDPDATPMRTGIGTRLGYHDHYVVDGGIQRIILAALVTPADVMENVPLRDLLWRVCFRRRLRPGQVTGDTTYGTIENIVAVEDAGIRAFFPLPDFHTRTRFFGKSKFTYDAVADLYRCLEGQPVSRRKTKYTEEEVVYRATQQPATRAGSKPSARPATAAAPSTVPSMRPTSTGCAATTRPRPSRRRCANETCGSSRFLPRRRSGVACAGSGCGASWTRTSRVCWWQPVRTSSATW